MSEPVRAARRWWPARRVRRASLTPSLARLSTVVIVVSWSLAVGATELPPGFVETTMFPPGQITGIRDFTWSPDGDLWVLQSGPGEGNKVWIVRGQSFILVHDFGTVPTGERGLQSLALDPDFIDNRQVWIYYTVLEDPIHNRLSRFTHVTADDTLQNEVAVVDGPAVTVERHNGGCLAFAADKTLFLGVGEDALWSVAAQDPFDLRGSILHITRDGAPAWDNPFADGVAGDPRVWALGLRNPWRCNVQPGTGNLFIGDVGSFRWEEVDIGIAGGNFGWAETEGEEPPALPGFTYPVYSYPSRIDGLGAAVIGGDHAESGELRPDWEGDYFFGERLRREIWRMELDVHNNPVQVELFATLDTPHLTTLKFGPDGALYYSAGGTIQNLRRIEYVGGANRQPTARAMATPASGAASLTVTLDATQSSDPDAHPLSYSWDLGDGNAAAGATVSHSYPQGIYAATLTVDDGNGLTHSAPPLRIVSGNHAPTAAITSPVDGATFRAGQTIAFSGSGSDPEDGAVPCARFGYQVLLHHDGHTHPVLGPQQGSCAGSFVTATRGETDIDVRYEIRLSVEDSGAPLGAGAELVGRHSVNLFPELAQITLQSAPRSDLLLTLDQLPATAPVVADSVIGFVRTIGAVDAQVLDAHTYRWLGWSDGGAREHEIVTPAGGASLLANFGCDVLVEATDLTVDLEATSGQLTLAWSPPPADPCLAAGAERYRIYAAPSARPTSVPGTWPVDPAFTLIGTSAGETFSYLAAPEHAYYIVVAVGSDMLDGAVGHYGR